MTTPKRRLLGVEQEASFEEIQDARNYLFEVLAATGWMKRRRRAVLGLSEGTSPVC
jgi:hypothetical protein